VEHLSAEFGGKVLRADVHAWTDSGWSAQRCATAGSLVNAKNNAWQFHLDLTAPRGSHRAEALRGRPELPPGRYLVKIYVDAAERLKGDPHAQLGEQDLAAQVEVDTAWPSGPNRATVIAYPHQSGNGPR
jgi:hypothetical protein